MKITSSQLQLASAHSSQQIHEASESLTVRENSPQRNGQGALLAMRASSVRQVSGEVSVAGLWHKSSADPVTLSNAGKAAQAADNAAATGARVRESPKTELIRMMLERWLGRSFRVFDGSRLASEADATTVYQRSESYTEIEETQFSASGVVNTADGRAISFQLDLSMSRAWHEESNLTIVSGNFGQAVKDPLVLNFAGTAASLTNERFEFDLDADGDMEKINFVAQGSGFLVFDRNRDGVVNDGRELFGPTTNNGFAELAALDDDGNGWIDENDAAFSQLQIWSRDATGNDRLQSLAAAGVGAISLSHIATPFDLKTTSNDLLGQIRSSGVFLLENGGVGTVQQVDLTV
ncbi:MAG: VCBS repeat-containing protein [Azonexus sp.]|jgi:hypothetical protein|nr:VCBS repeat-containing protein [Azonexus sp.]